MKEGSGPKPRHERHKAPHPPFDRAIAELAARQRGLVTFKQLRGIGLSTSAIEDRVRAGRLHRVYRGVFAVGHPLLTVSERRMAAVLACGAGAALSHRSGACNRGLRTDNRAQIDVTSPTRAGRRIKGITAHSGATLLAPGFRTPRATLGWRVVRFSWRQVTTEPGRVAATVAALHAAQRP